MENANMVKSLLNTGEDYVQIQAYMRNDEDVLHIQGKGPVVNRNYGISADIEISEMHENLMHWISNIPRNHSSFAGTGKLYFDLNMRHVPSQDQLNFQILRKESRYNTKYGGMFIVDAYEHLDLVTFWNRCTGIKLPEEENQELGSDPDPTYDFGHIPIVEEIEN